ncbi:hypothetical protein JCM15764A_31640 [Geotalea toluenoxydans]
MDQKNADGAGRRNVHFVGRLAQYRYMNMDEIVAKSLEVFGLIARKQQG